MVKAWALSALLFGMAAAGPAAAQPQADPFNGQLGAFELAFPPREATRQVKLLGDALDAVEPQRPGRLDVYVLVAAFWGDPVFEREATQAEAILREHFNAEGRTIVLSAGTGAAERRYPAATPNNLNAALGRIGQVIDADEDLVVVFLTSHGAPDGAMGLRENNRLSAWLRPANLRDALAGAGVQNRVVIVSSCFSGAFIAPLMDERTIVLTAAAPDRSSFGCQPERDWTFFGDALFNHNVRTGEPLLRSFDQAKALIQQWERERSLSPPSNPQRYVGARAEQMLTQAEREAR